ncbi:MAG: epoxyqueuosine reductase QueH [Solobacterium sp.]|nr:epoxyqueuosine reductase QueH [Solobacterium sp.]
MNKEAYAAYLKQRKSSHKTNYYLVSLKELEEIHQKYDHKPSLLLHACCAVCASFPLELLSQHFELTVFFNNSNIWPQAEYDRRLSELYRYLQEANPSIPVVVTPYNNEEYMKPLEPMKDDPEGFGRCFYCYAVRLREAFAYAEEHEFDFVTTVMSISRQKDSQKINEIGRSLSRLYPSVSYFYSDFKKGGGQLRQKELVDEHQLYRQDYCGCIYSYTATHPEG